jgi:hypothetical protein
LSQESTFLLTINVSLSTTDSPVKREQLLTNA